MKKLGIISIILMALLLSTTIACSSGDQEPPKHTVNNYTGAVSGDGNIVALYHEKLTFGSGGRVSEVTVKEGDPVGKGDVLARLDTDALELAEATAQVALAKAQTARSQAELALTQAEIAKEKAKSSLQDTLDRETSLKLALANAQIAVRTARFNLERTTDLYTWSDIKTAKADVDNSQKYLDDLLVKVGLFLPQDDEGQYPLIADYIFEDAFFKGEAWEGWQDELVHAQARLRTARDRLDAMLGGNDPEEVMIKQLQLDSAEQAERIAQGNLGKIEVELAIKNLEVDSAIESVDYAQQNVALAQQNVTLAQKSLSMAEKNIQEATITAPFDGIVARVGVKEGEFLSPGAYTAATVVELIDPTQLELIARVVESDIVMVTTGQKAMITLDAMPETELEGQVTYIYPTARDPGTVLFEDEDEEKEYEVKIAFDIPDNSPVRAGMSATVDIMTE